MKTLGRLINAQQAKAWLDALYIDLKPLQVLLEELQPQAIQEGYTF